MTLPDIMAALALLTISMIQVGCAKKEAQIASMENRYYHEESCRWAMKIPNKDIVFFANETDAKAEGYAPCPVCHNKIFNDKVMINTQVQPKTIMVPDTFTQPIELRN